MTPLPASSHRRAGGCRPRARFAFAAALTVLSAAAAAAPIVVWTGGGGTGGSWSDPANWDLLRPPVDGDAVLFTGRPTTALSFVDLTVRLETLSFAPTAAPFEVHVDGAGSHVLTFSGAGIENLTGSSGPIRQGLFADGGSSGGSIVFAGHSGINLGSSASYRPVDLTAVGGGAPASLGGRIVFQDDASTGLATFNSLRATGAAFAGAGAGQVVFRDNAVAAKFTTVTMTGGGVAGAAGGLGSFADSARLDGTVNALASPAGGLGGRVVFSGNAVAGVTSSINNDGGSGAAGAEGATEFRGSARLSGTVVNGAANTAGASGGRLEFRDTAAFDSGGYDGSLGALQIINNGARTAGANGARVVFHDDSAARGANLVIVNGANSEGAVAGSLAGATLFADRSRAGQVTIYNQSGANGGETLFQGAASAENAHIFSSGGQASAMRGGQVSFADDASAGAARIDNEGAAVAGATAAFTFFFDRSSAGSATIVNGAGLAATAFGGSTLFRNGNGAGSAFITNEASSAGGAGGGTTFSVASSAQRAAIDNRGGASAGGEGGRTLFTDQSSAGDARITNLGGRANGARGGDTVFVIDATAGSASFVNAGGSVAGAFGGATTFVGGTTGASATFLLQAGGVLSGHGGTLTFQAGADAGTSRITIEGGRFASTGIASGGGSLRFESGTSAGSAIITLGGGRAASSQGAIAGFVATSVNPADAGPTAARSSLVVRPGEVDGASGGFLAFVGRGTDAGFATILNEGGAFAGPLASGNTTFGGGASAGRATIVNGAGSGSGGTTQFREDSNAGSAMITNLGGSLPNTGGVTAFFNDASAANATIVNVAGTGLGDGITAFRSNSTAANATLVAQGSRSDDASPRGPAYVRFAETSTAAASTLIAEGAANGGRGSVGGLIYFQDQASGGTARVILESGRVAGGAAGTLDIGWLTNAGTRVGSIEGGGNVFLGSRNLEVGGNGRSTTFAGLVRDGGLSGGSIGGSLTVIGTGALTLAGANSYSGGTVIGDGIRAGSGKLVAANATGSATGSGPVTVQRGGTLSGSGAIDGAVVLRAGGTIAPGDPVTLTLRDSLTWDGGGVIRLVLGASSAESDHLNVGSLIRGADGVFAFDLVDWGITAGAEYDVLSFDSLVGFAAADFSVTGVDGIFAIEQGHLAFTALQAQAVPEPSTLLLMAGGIALWAARRRLRRA